jgi:hypothetical protein
VCAEPLTRFARSLPCTTGGDQSFSMTTYFAGVGIVVAALALGFGSRIVLTNTAIKDSPAGPTRIERVTRPRPIAPPPQGVEAKAVAGANQATAVFYCGLDVAYGPGCLKMQMFRAG